MPELGTQRVVVPMAGFELELDGIGNVRPKTVGAIEEEMSLIEIREGGSIRVVQHEVNLITTAPIEIERVLDLSDLRASDLWEQTKSTQNVHFSGTAYYSKAGVRVAKRELLDCIMIKYGNFEGDADNEDEIQMEKFTIQVRKVEPIEVIE